MASVHDPVNDCGPEFSRRLEREISRAMLKSFHDIARSSGNCREAAERAQAEADRLLSLTDEEAGHALAF